MLKRVLLLCLASSMLLCSYLSTSLAVKCRKLVSINRFKRATMDSSIMMISEDKFAYGPTDWLALREGKKFVVDKTYAIETLEGQGPYLQCWRPIRFGKTLLCSQLRLYYDVKTSDEKVS